jgi:hypothetical protein
MSLTDYIKSTPQEFEGRPLTALPSPHDPRDYKYPRILSTKAPLRDTGGPIDYRENMPSVFDQKQRGSCVACATAWTPKAFQEINEGDFPVSGLSASYLYTRCKQLDGIPNDEGTYPRTAMQVLYKYGICPEDAMPYSTLSSLPAPRVPGIPVIADAQAGKYKISAYAQLADYIDVDRSGLLATIRQALLREGPIVLALLVCSNFVPDSMGRLPLPQGTIQGGHAVGIVGHLPEIKCLILRNTWGKDWGINGYAYLPEEWLTWTSDVYKSVFEAWTATDSVVPKRAKEIIIVPGAYTMNVDGVQVMLDQPAFITGADRTMLPIRAVAANMGYIVDWRDGKVILTDPS